MSILPSFAELAGTPGVSLDVLSLALAVEFRDVDAAWAMERLDGLGVELSRALERKDGTARVQMRTCAELLYGQHGFVGDSQQYDHPDNSMLDLVLAKRRGLPILLSVVYVEVARRAGVPLAGVGLPGHFVVGHFGVDPPLLLDPFAGGSTVETGKTGGLVRPWPASEIAMRMLNNLVAAYQRRGDLGAAIRAARMRLALPSDESLRKVLRAEMRAMQAQLN
ncbi:MAG: transglutaminase family protein [Solirubrobacteraceae bacterium]